MFSFNLSPDISTMDWSVLSKKYFDTDGGGGVVIVWASVDRLMLSLDTDCFFCVGRHN